ncbi:hypothetical protein [Dactylosporangium sp. NPDC006015]|uniref:hypothetical protein n=1 Tax=Dactylosporangium sp. NPDC006015 TaxID=3154576 RepID=UPI0033A3B119
MPEDRPFVDKKVVVGVQDSGAGQYRRAVEQAVAVAGGGIVGVGPGQVASQCLDAGLLDGLRINLVPVVLGGGVRVLRELVHAGKLARFEEPTIIVGRGVTHLDYRLRR